MKYVYLSEIGLPYIVLFETGVMYDEIQDCYRYPQKDGSVEIVSSITGERIRTKIKHLLSYYFEAPWTGRIVVPFRHLVSLGFENYFVTCDGRVYSLKRCEYLVGNKSFDGYSRVLMFSSKENTFKTEIVHRLVTKMFIPNPENKPEVNHIDGDKDNNHVSNLEWVYPFENIEHALNNNLRKRSLSDEQIHQICGMLENGHTVTDIMRALNVPKHAVLGIKSGCHYRISKQYNIPRNKHF